MNNNIVKDSFVAVSDFHGYEWPLEKVINNYLNEYDKIFILGDITDRGENYDGKDSIKLLQKVKKLSEKYPERINYIPGNHDQFIYDYAHSQNDYYAHLMRINGGSETVKELDSLKENNKQEFDELISWLGDLPLQKMHTFANQKYALAHAFFNNKIYKQNPSFSLKDAYQSKQDKSVQNILWFRKAKDTYSKEEVPSGDVIEVIGHTPESYRNDMCLDLENSDNETVKVHCVDGGIAYGGTMLKYDGKESSIKTQVFCHNDTSPKVEEKHQPSSTKQAKDNNNLSAMTNDEITASRIKLGFINPESSYDTTYYLKKDQIIQDLSISSQEESRYQGAMTDDEITASRIKLGFINPESSYDTTYCLKKEHIIQDLSIYSQEESRYQGAMTEGEIKASQKKIGSYKPIKRK